MEPAKVKRFLEDNEESNLEVENNDILKQYEE
jgi:hypothetical protein